MTPKKSLISLISITFLASLLGAITIANADPTQDIQALANSFVQQNQSPTGLSGVSVTAQCPSLNNNTPVTVFSGTIGHGTYDSTPIKSNDVWQIGSNSKSFASIVLIQLASEPQYHFSLDDPISKWINATNYPQLQYLLRYNPTVRQLLNMTAGVPDDYNTALLHFVIKNPFTYEQPAFWIGFADAQSATAPGAGFTYSNANYDISGILVPAITGHSLQTEVNNRIIKPLGLHNTYFIYNLPEEQVNSASLVHGYITSSDGTVYDPSDWSMSSSPGSGEIISTTADINTYYRALYTTNILVNATQLAELSSFVSDLTGQPIAAPADATDGRGYALGIGADNFDVYNNYIYTHTGKPFIPFGDTNLLTNIRHYDLVYVYPGSMPGFQFTYFYNPVNNASVVVSYNSDNVSSSQLPLAVLNYMDPICQPISK